MDGDGRRPFRRSADLDRGRARLCVLRAHGAGRRRRALAGRCRRRHRAASAPPGGGLVGFGVLAAYLVLHELRPRPFRTAALLAGGAAALLATPQLGRTALYYSGVLHGETAAQHYGLWAPLSLHRPLDVLFLALA